MHPSLRLLPVCIAVSFAAQAAEPASDEWVLCRGTDAIPAFREAPAPGKLPDEEAPTDVDAATLQYQDKERTVFAGDVKLERGGQWLGADQVTYLHDKEEYEAKGNVRYEDRNMRLVADEARGYQTRDRTELDDVRYQMLSQRGNGRADKAVMQGPRGTLTGATYSTCDPQDRKWELRARAIKIDRDKGFGTARHATIRAGNIPVLYAPWFSFPIDDRRKSGFLYPSVAQSDNRGFEVFIPYYLNLAPNYDATLTAHIMSQRGLMLDGEFRYRTQRNRGTLSSTWLPSDEDAFGEVKGEDRYFVQFSHFTAFNPNWYARVGVNRVSDDQYFEDFGDSLAQSAIRLLPSSAGIFGRGTYWAASLDAYAYQVTDVGLPPRSEPFRVLPRLTFNYEQPFGDVFTLGMNSTATNFEHEALPGGKRVDLKPYARADIEGAWWFLRPQVAYRYTTYNLGDTLRSDLGDDQPSRALPIYSLDSGLFFERDTGLFGHDLIQTLEPRLYYLRVPYRDQSGIPIFDSRPLTFSYAALFRDNTFSGADRQSDANQLTGAITTRFFETDSGRELLSASLGRIHYFDPPRVTTSIVEDPEPVDLEGSFYVADVDINLDDRWSVGASQQWDPETSRTQLSSVRGQYRFGAGGVVNAAYRFRRGVRPDQADQIEQVDVSTLYPLSPSWRLIGRWNYSLFDRSEQETGGVALERSTLEAMAGVEWEGCCIAVRVLGRHYVTNSRGEKNNAIYAELELKGLGAFGRKSEDLLTRAILGYTR